MCDLMKRACYSQEGVVEFECDCVRLSVPTHPGVRQEQTCFFQHHRGQATVHSAVSSAQCGGGENHPNSFLLALVIWKFREVQVIMVICIRLK